MADRSGRMPAARPAEERASEDGGRFLLIERPAIPWQGADEWNASDRADYERARRREQVVVLLDGASGRAPALLRESLLSMSREDGSGDEAVRRELARLALAGRQ